MFPFSFSILVVAGRFSQRFQDKAFVNALYHSTGIYEEVRSLCHVKAEVAGQADFHSYR
jgi:hypothetical protein